VSVTLAVDDCVRVCDAERDSLTDAEELSAGDRVADGDGAADEESEREGVPNEREGDGETDGVNELLPLRVRDSLAPSTTACEPCLENPHPLQSSLSTRRRLKETSTRSRCRRGRNRH